MIQVSVSAERTALAVALGRCGLRDANVAFPPLRGEAFLTVPFLIAGPLRFAALRMARRAQAGQRRAGAHAVGKRAELVERRN